MSLPSDPKKIVLTTLNATYFHCSLGLRYLKANLGDLESSCSLVEFTINENTRDIAEKLVALRPAIIGFGVYIWNVVETEEVIGILKRICPETLIVIGGPEVSHESEGQSICALADVTLRGEADHSFRELCSGYLAQGTRPLQRLRSSPLPEIKSVAMPYRLYSDEDIAKRVIYVEASRGCPYKCEFCLSALDESVRNFPLDAFLAELNGLLERGARQFKFVDRTFNLSIKTCTRILQFFLEGMEKIGQQVEAALFLHFELVPDRLPEELRVWLTRFPAGAVQFEVGIQTWNPEISRRISRRQDYEKIRQNLTFLRQETGIHIHSDLIVGLPGESLESFGRGFDELAALRPHEIQIGILKKLHGAPIARHDSEWGMIYEQHPPYAILQTSALSFVEVQQMMRFARFWDHYANRGNFPGTVELLRDLSSQRPCPSLFAEFFQFASFLAPRHPHLHSIALVKLAESAWEYFTAHRGVSEERARQVLAEDYMRPSGREIPAFLQTVKAPSRRGANHPPMREPRSPLPARQQRHLSPPVPAPSAIPAVATAVVPDSEVNS